MQAKAVAAGGVLLAGGIVLLVRSIMTATGRGVTLEGPTLAPIIVTGLWVLVAGAYLISTVRSEQERTPVQWRNPALLLVALVVYAFVIKYTVVGYVLATFAFVLASAWILGGRRPGTTVLATAVGLSVGIYLVFTRLLGISLPQGVLPL